MFRRLTPFAAELWEHRALLWQFTVRNVELRHKGSHLGLVWSFLNPLLMLALYVVIFGFVLGGSFGVTPHETRTEYGLGIFFGLALFHFVSEVLALSPLIIVSNPNFVKKVVFPLEILPPTNVFGAVFHLLITYAMLLVGLLAFGAGLTWYAVWLPIVIFPVILLMLGVSWFVSALGVFFRDINQIMQFGTIALMFGSAVFYPAEKISRASPLAWEILRFNPVLLAIEMSRNVVLWSRPLNMTHLCYLYVLGLVVCVAGHAVFRKMKTAFADVL